MEITKITSSKLRGELLSLYFTNPEKKYYIRQLARLLDSSPGNIRRELVKLEEAGLFESRREGNLVYYFLNKDYPLREELKRIVFKTVGVAGSLRAALSRIKGIEIAFIYGSFAEEKERTASDIDVFIVGHPDEDELLEEIDELEGRLQREINYAIYGRQEYNQRRKREDSFILEVTGGPKVFLIGDENEL